MSQPVKVASDTVRTVTEDCMDIHNARCTGSKRPKPKPTGKPASTPFTGK